MFSPVIFALLLASQTANEVGTATTEEEAAVETNDSNSSSATLVAQAVELLQKHRKKEALKKLEKAFQLSQDPTELREICALILESSPLDYPKRDAYLNYLVKYQPEHKDMVRWLKELGDRSLDKGRLQDAEEWYLRAIALSEDKTMLRYKLAWARWNLKRRIEALQTFMEIWKEAPESLQKQLAKDISKIWWETGPMPPALFDFFLNLPAGVRDDILAELLTPPSPTKEAGESEESLLLQLNENKATRVILQKAISENFYFKKNPCLLFKKVISTNEEAPAESLLACTRSSKRLSAYDLLLFFENVSKKTEAVDWAHAELLTEQHRASEAIRLLLSPKNLSNRSADYMKYAASLLLKIKESDFRKLYDSLKYRPFESMLQKYFEKDLVIRLEAVDADRWIPIEEKTYEASPLPKDFLVRKGVWLAQKDEDDEKLTDVFKLLLDSKLTAKEEQLKKSYATLSERLQTVLPEEFSKVFKKEYDAWIKDLDRSLKTLHRASNDWQIIAKPVFQKLIEQNVASLIGQIEKLSIASESVDLIQAFQEKKESLKSQLKKKYLEEQP